MAIMFATIMNVGMYWFSDKIVLRMYNAQPVTEAEAPELYAIVHTLVQKAGMPMPNVYIIPDETPNAFATGTQSGACCRGCYAGDHAYPLPRGAGRGDCP